MCRAEPSAHGSSPTRNRHSRKNPGIMRKTRNPPTVAPLSNVQHHRDRPKKTPTRLEGALRQDPIGEPDPARPLRPRPPEPRRRSPRHTHSDLWVTASVDGAGCARPEPHGPRRGRRPRTLDRSVGCRTRPPSEHSEQARTPPDWFQREKRRTQKEGSGRGRRSETVSVV